MASTTKKYLEILGKKMAYVEEGEGDPDRQAEGDAEE